MNIVICIMSTKTNPSIRNNRAFKETVVSFCNKHSSELKHTYTFVFYYADSSKCVEVDNDYNNVYHFTYDETESVHRTFEKTVQCLTDVMCKFNPDLYIRTNISTFLNIKLLDAVADKFVNGNVYCNKINCHLNLTSPYCNDVYPRGDFMIFDSSITNAIITQGKKYMYIDNSINDYTGVDHVDDCLFGLCLQDEFGRDYFKRLQTIYYNFIPEPEPDYVNVNLMCIASRLKTTPPGYNSGYSWDDNEYRMKDVDKFYRLQNIFECDVTYSDDISLDLICSSKEYQYVIYKIVGLNELQYEQTKKSRLSALFCLLCNN